MDTPDVYDTQMFDARRRVADKIGVTTSRKAQRDNNGNKLPT